MTLKKTFHDLYRTDHMRSEVNTGLTRYHQLHVDAEDYVSKNKSVCVDLPKRQTKSLKSVISSNLPLSKRPSLAPSKSALSSDFLTNPKVICAEEHSHVFETNVDWILEGRKRLQSTTDTPSSERWQKWHFTPTFCINLCLHLLYAVTFSGPCVVLPFFPLFKYRYCASHWTIVHLKMNILAILVSMNCTAGS